jgi:hypothetical protein
MFFPSLGVNEMGGFIPSVETILDERATQPMLLVGVVEKRTNMTVLIESTAGVLEGLPLVYIFSPSRSEPRVKSAGVLCHG